MRGRYCRLLRRQKETAATSSTGVPIVAGPMTVRCWCPSAQGEQVAAFRCFRIVRLVAISSDPAAPLSARAWTVRGH
mgnify:CR=1